MRCALDREDPLNIEIRTQPLAGPALLRDYLSGEGRARAYYQGAPREVAAFARKWEEVQRRFGTAEREQAARALRPTSPRARERLERFVREGGAVVTTGQQAGLLGGPLYTVYKALSVVRLAESLEGELGVPVLPVFWTASEDHDWAEVNHAYLLGPGGEPRRLDLPSDADDVPLPMSERVLGEGVKPVLDDVRELLRGQPFEALAMKCIRDAYAPGRTVAQAFSDLLADLLAPYDLLLTDAADPHLKQASAPVLRLALGRAAEHAAVLRARSTALLEDGYHAQATVLDEATNLFYHGEGRRERIDRSGAGFFLRDSHRAVGREALLAELDADPARFSPNVLLRPVVESAVFPTLGYVGGPGEIAYFAQANALFPEFGILPPVAVPRASFTLVEPAIRRLLSRLHLSAADLSRPRHELATRLARESVPEDVREGLAELARSVAGGYRRLIQETEAIDPTLQGTLGALRNESLARVEEAERKIVGRLREREATTLAQMDRVRAQLRPLGEPQERVLSVVPYLAGYGPDLLSRILAQVEIVWEDAAAAHPGPVPEGAP